ncbi:MAG: hypothetical protein WBL68_07745 [Nitrososphaeraceae archaeon]
MQSTTSTGTSYSGTEEISTSPTTSGTTMRLDSSSGQQHIFNFGKKEYSQERYLHFLDIYGQR